MKNDKGEKFVFFNFFVVELVPNTFKQLNLSRHEAYWIMDSIAVEWFQSFSP